MTVKWFGSGGIPRAKTFSAYVPLTTGLLTTVSTYGLLAPVAFAKTGGNTNLTLNTSTGAISATAALAVGTSQSINGTVTGADGVVLPWSGTLTGAYTLASLGLSASTFSTSVSPGTTIATITGNTPGSTITLTDTQGGVFALSNPSTDVWRIVAGLTAPSATSYAPKVTETLSGAVGSPNATTFSLTASAYTFPALTTLDIDGTSLDANASKISYNAGAITTTTGASSFGSSGFHAAKAGGKWLYKAGAVRARGSSTTERMMYCMSSTSIASFGTNTTTAAAAGHNPAYDDTALLADSDWCIQSDGLYTALNSPGAGVVSATLGSNDNTSFYNNPYLASKTMTMIRSYASQLLAAGKVLIVGNGQPRGLMHIQSEKLVFSGNTATVSRAVNFVDGPTYGATPVVGLRSDATYGPFTKVSSAPAQDQYTVNATTGSYTFGGTAPTGAWATYTGAHATQGFIGTTTFMKVLNEWYNSSAADFVSAIDGNDYGIPGLQYNLPNVIVYRTYESKVDTNGNLLPGLGGYDDLQLHESMRCAYRNGKTLDTTLAAHPVYGSAPDRRAKPTRNNWYAAKGTGNAFTYSGTLPPTMRTSFTGGTVPTLVSINGTVRMKADIANMTGNLAPLVLINGSTISLVTGVANSYFNVVTGDFVITVTTKADIPNNGEITFEQEIGNGTFDGSGNWVEGTIKRNCRNNPLLDMTPATTAGIGSAAGSNLAKGTGTCSVTGTSITDAMIPYGYTFAATGGAQAAITAGTVSVSVATGFTSDGFPYFAQIPDGIHTAAWGFALTQVGLNSASRVASGDQFYSATRFIINAHPTKGHIYGTAVFSLTDQFNTSVTKHTPTGDQVATIMSNTVPIGAGGPVNGTAPSYPLASGNYIDDNLLAETPSGTFDEYLPAMMSDTTGAAINAFNWTIGSTFTAGVPAAAWLGTAQLQDRGRNDV